MEAFSVWLERVALELGSRMGEGLRVLGWDANLLGVIALYLFCFAWLTYQWRTRHRPSRARERQRGLAAADGIVRVLGGVILLILGIFLALARAAGRPYDRRW